MKTWWINTLTFLGMLARIFEFLFIRPIKHLLPQNLLNKWIHLISYRIKTYRIVLNRIILTGSPNSP